MLWGLGLCDTRDAHTRGEQLPWHSEPKPAPCPCCPWGLVALLLPHLILWREITTTQWQLGELLLLLLHFTDL